jgi:vacuolar-type H+-ATPase subunit I/STV1
MDYYLLNFAMLFSGFIDFVFLQKAWHALGLFRHNQALVIMQTGKKNYGFSARIRKPVQVIAEVHELTASKSEVVTIATVSSPAAAEIRHEEIVQPINVKIDVVSVEPVIETPVAAVVTEETLKMKILEETSSREQRLKNLSSLQSKISQSIARKSEVELAIVQEIESLRDSFTKEINIETNRLKQLEKLYQTFIETLIYKKTLLQSECNVLQQMKDVKEKILEKSILEQLENAVVKKDSLIKIEQDICKDINDCSNEINSEIDATRNKLVSLQNAMNALPPSGNASAYRSYSWLEVERLQKGLVSYLEGSMTREGKIRDFVTAFDSLTKRRGLVLGVNTILPEDVAAQMPSPVKHPIVAEEDEMLQAKVYIPAIVKLANGKEKAAPDVTIDALKQTGSSLADASARLVIL